jgi:hypothetical protein
LKVYQRKKALMRRPGTILRRLRVRVELLMRDMGRGGCSAMGDGCIQA